MANCPSSVAVPCPLLFAQWKYNHFYAAVFGQSTALPVILSKVSLDIFVSGPFIYFPLYFIVKGLFAGQGPLASLREYISSNGMSILRRYWMVRSFLPSLSFCRAHLLSLPHISWP